MSEPEFERAIDAFTAALGPAKVLTSDADLREFRDPFQYVAWDDYTASAVLMPTTLPHPRSAIDSMRRCPPASIAS